MSKTDNTAALVESFEQIRDTLPGGWLSDIRSCAIESFEEQGFPTQRTEAWKYTNLNRLTRYGFDPAAVINVPDVSQWTSLFVDAADRIVVANGMYNSEASEIGNLPNGASIVPLSEAVEDTAPELEEQISKIAPSEDAPFVALNTAFMRDGVVLKLEAGVQLERPLQVVHLVDPGDRTPAVHPRTLIVAGDNCSATVVETFCGAPGAAYWTNAVTEIRVGNNASVSHFKRQGESVGAYHTALTQVRLSRCARYRSVALGTGAVLSRNETRVAFEGEGADASLAGGALLRGRQHADNTTEADHTVRCTNSRQIFRNVLDDASHSVFQGGVIVRQDAQKTDSSQSSRNLLLSEGAQADTKPELQIFADDVKCAHGATVGDLDKDALFYLQSRGIPADQAKKLLIKSFISEILGDLDDGPVNGHFADAVSDWLTEHKR